MFELVYLYGVILGCFYVYRTLSNDPEKEKIWGKSNKEKLLAEKENEIGLLKSQLEHYYRYSPANEKELTLEKS